MNSWNHVPYSNESFLQEWAKIEQKQEVIAGG